MKYSSCKLISLSLIIIILLTSYAPNIQAQSKIINVTFNGRFLDFDQPPVIINGRVLVPLRAIFEAMGATVKWIPEHKQE